MTLVSVFSTYYEARREKRGLRHDVEHRAEVFGESLVANVEPYQDENSVKQLQRIVGRFSNREHLFCGRDPGYSELEVLRSE